MKPKLDFSSRVAKTLKEAGFIKEKKCYKLNLSESTLLIDIQFAHQCRYYMNVGFFIPSLGGRPPERVPSCHCYFRLERIFPEHRELILLAGDTEEGKQSDLDELVELLKVKIWPALLLIASSHDKLREAYRSARLTRGLITIAAREFFQKT